MHLIKNWDEVAVTEQRQHALRIFETVIAAVQPGQALHRKLSRQANLLTVGQRTYDLDQFKNIFVVGIGKAALDAAAFLEEVLGDRLSSGIVLDTRTGPLQRLVSLAGTHPLPTEVNVRATERICAAVSAAQADDLVLVIVSGGGSALLCQPYDLTCEEVSRITGALITSGAAIEEINTVRKHISEVQGGQLARLAYPAAMVGLIFCDIPSEDMSLVASGPTFLDRSTVQDAEKILTKYDVIKTCRLEGCTLRETPKSAKLFAKVHNELIVNGAEAARSMAQEAERLGYEAIVYATNVTGEARAAGQQLATLPQPGQAVIAAGETTVTITSTGAGGRNLEVALGALDYLPPAGLVISFASDGIDNVPVAGAIADQLTEQKADRLSLSTQEALAHNQSLKFFEQTGDTIVTGPTGTNVSDLMLALNGLPKKKQSRTTKTPAAENDIG